MGLDPERGLIMPCYDHRDSPDYVRKEVRAEMQKEIDRMAQWLCHVLGALEKMGIDITQHDPELAKWWTEHKAFDEARKDTK